MNEHQTGPINFVQTGAVMFFTISKAVPDMRSQFPTCTLPPLTFDALEEFFKIYYHPGTYNTFRLHQVIADSCVKRCSKFASIYY